MICAVCGGELKPGERVVEIQTVERPSITGLPTRKAGYSHLSHLSPEPQTSDAGRES